MKFLEYGELTICLGIDRYKHSDNIGIVVYIVKYELRPLKRIEDVTMTVDFNDEKLEDGYAYVDTYRCPFACDLIERFELGIPTGETKKRGGEVFPKYKFDIEKLKMYTPASRNFL